MQYGTCVQQQQEIMSGKGILNPLLVIG